MKRVISMPLLLILLLAAGGCASIPVPDRISDDELAGLQRAADRAYDDGICARAIPLYRRIVAKRPKQDQAWFRLGNCLALSGDSTGAQIAWQNVLSSQPSMHGAWYNLAAAQLHAAEKTLIEMRRVLGDDDPLAEHIDAIINDMFAALSKFNTRMLPPSPSPSPSPAPQPGMAAPPASSSVTPAASPAPPKDLRASEKTVPVPAPELRPAAASPSPSPVPPQAAVHPDEPAPATPPSTRQAMPRQAPVPAAQYLDGVYGPVRPGENLSSIAQQVVDVTGVHVAQALWGLYASNRQAFSGSINRLRVGATLQLPSVEALEKISVQQARANIRRALKGKEAPADEAGR